MSKHKVRTYRMAPRASGEAAGRADLIPCNDGTLGYLRIEDGDGRYVGSLERGALRHLARAIAAATGEGERRKG